MKNKFAFLPSVKSPRPILWALKFFLHLLGYENLQEKSIHNHQKNKYKYLVKYFTILLINIALIFFIGACVLTLTKPGYDYQLCFQFICPVVQIYLYSIYFHLRSKDIFGFIKEVEFIWSQEKENEAGKFILQADKKCNKLLKISLIYFLANMNFIILGFGFKSVFPNFLSKSTFEIPMSIFDDYSDHFWLLFTLVYFFTYPIGLSCCLSFTMMISFNYHIHAIVDIIEYKMSMITTERQTFSQLEQENAEKFIKSCLKCHASLLRMVNYLNQTTSFPNISLFLVSCIQCCLGLWHISRSGNIEFDFIGNLVVLYGWPFIVAWCSSQIESASDRLTIAPFESNWYKLKPRVRKYFIVYLTMCNQDIRVAYRTIFPINLQQFIWVLQYSYSFYTVVAR